MHSTQRAAAFADLFCFEDNVVQPRDVWRVKAGSRYQDDRYDLCLQFYDDSFISHALFRLDECDLAGKTFVDLGSGVGQVLPRNCNTTVALYYIILALDNCA